MNRDIELDAWRGQWQTQSEAPVAADLRARMARETRWMKIGLIAPVLVTIAIGGGVLVPAVSDAKPAAVTLAIEVWFFILLTWVGALWIGRGTWRPLGETTAAFVDLAVRRCRGNLRGAQFGAVLYIGELLLIPLWNLRYVSVGVWALLASWPVIALGWIGAPAFFGFLLWYAPRKRAELAYLLDVQRQLNDESL